MKKALSLILAVVMMLALTALPVMADEEITATITAGVVEADNRYGATTLTGAPAQAVRIIFGNGWVPPGFEVAWGIGILPEGAEFTSPDVAGITWYNCDNDENVKIGEDDSNTRWGAEGNWPGFVWAQDENGDHYFNPLFQIPEAELNAAGFDNLWAAAEAGRLVGYIAGVVADDAGTEADGIIRGTGDQQDILANATNAAGNDCCIWTFQTADAYYGPDAIPADENAIGWADCSDRWSIEAPGTIVSNPEHGDYAATTLNGAALDTSKAIFVGKASPDAVGYVEIDIEAGKYNAFSTTYMKVDWAHCSSATKIAVYAIAGETKTLICESGLVAHHESEDVSGTIPADATIIRIEIDGETNAASNGILYNTVLTPAPVDDTPDDGGDVPTGDATLAAVAIAAVAAMGAVLVIGKKRA